MPRRERHLKETTWIRSVHLLDADVFSRTTYISKCGAWGKALEAFAGFSAGRVEPSFVTYNALSSAFDRGSRWQEAGLVMTTMRADGVEADVVTYNTAFSALQTSSQWRNVGSLLRSMAAGGTSLANHLKVSSRFLILFSLPKMS